MKTEKLEPKHKRLIVERLAAFQSLRDIQEEIEKEHKIKPSLQAIAAYNPATVAGQRMSKEYKDLFARVREASIADDCGAAIAHRAFRLRILTQIAEECMAKKNYGMAMKALDQAARERGGLYIRPADAPPDTGTERMVEMFGEAINKIYSDGPTAEPGEQTSAPETTSG